MRKRTITLGVVAGGVALAGLAGSAYGETAHQTRTARTAQAVKATKAVKAAPGTRQLAVACAAPGMRPKGKPAKGTVTIKEPGKLRSAKESQLKAPGKVLTTHGKLPAPPPGAKGVTKVIAKNGTVRIIAPKGVHCTQVKPGTLPPLPRR